MPVVSFIKEGELKAEGGGGSQFVFCIFPCFLCTSARTFEREGGGPKLQETRPILCVRVPSTTPLTLLKISQRLERFGGVLFLANLYVSVVSDVSDVSDGRRRCCVDGERLRY